MGRWLFVGMILLCALTARSQKFRKGISLGYGMSYAHTREKNIYIDEKKLSVLYANESKKIERMVAYGNAGVGVPLLLDLGSVQLGIEPSVYFIQYAKSYRKANSEVTQSEKFTQGVVATPVTLQYTMMPKRYKSLYISVGYMPTYAFVKSTDLDISLRKQTFTNIIDSYLYLEGGVSNWFFKKYKVGNGDRTSLYCAFRLNNINKNTILFFGVKVSLIR